MKLTHAPSRPATPPPWQGELCKGAACVELACQALGVQADAALLMRCGGTNEKVSGDVGDGRRGRDRRAEIGKRQRVGPSGCCSNASALHVVARLRACQALWRGSQRL